MLVSRLTVFALKQNTIKVRQSITKLLNDIAPFNKTKPKTAYVSKNISTLIAGNLYVLVQQSRVPTKITSKFVRKLLPMISLSLDS